MRISDWSSDVCSSDLREGGGTHLLLAQHGTDRRWAPACAGAQGLFSQSRSWSGSAAFEAMLERDLAVEQLRHRAILLGFLGDFREFVCGDPRHLAGQRQRRFGDRDTSVLLFEIGSAQ